MVEACFGNYLQQGSEEIIDDIMKEIGFFMQHISSCCKRYLIKAIYTIYGVEFFVLSPEYNTLERSQNYTCILQPEAYTV